MSDKASFVVGDVVQLKGGSSPKCVDHVYDTGEISVVWFADRELCRAKLPAACLERIGVEPDATVDAWRSCVSGVGACIDQPKNFGDCLALAIGRFIMGADVALVCRTHAQRNQVFDVMFDAPAMGAFFEGRGVWRKVAKSVSGTLRVCSVDIVPSGTSFDCIVIAPKS